MANSFNALAPSVVHQLFAMGQRIREARLRRKLSVVIFSKQVGIARDTLSRLEKGDPSIAMGSYMKALEMLSLEADIDLIALDEAFSQKMLDQQLRSWSDWAITSLKTASEEPV